MRESAISVGEFERWGGLAIASAAVLYGLSRRSTAGFVLAAGAVPLAYRSLAGHWPGVGNGNRAHDTKVALGGDRGIHVRESIRINCPVQDVYRFWRALENLPRFMTHLERVTD